MDQTFEHERMENIRVAFINQCDDLGVNRVYAWNAVQLLVMEILRLQSQEFGSGAVSAS